jgi:uncharacterized protein YyaL (SSP411 family)
MGQEALTKARLEDASERALTTLYPCVDRQSAAFTTLLTGIKENLSPPNIVIVRGPASELIPWQKQLNAAYLPHTFVLCISNGMSGLPATLTKPDTTTVNARVCRGVSCLPAVTTPEALIALCKGTRDD